MRGSSPARLGGYAIAAGTTILFAPYPLHRAPRLWERPEAVDVDRFASEAENVRHKLVYLPFSAGRRGCIGEQVVWAGGVLVLAAVAQRWRLPRVGPLPPSDGSVSLQLETP